MNKIKILILLMLFPVSSVCVKAELLRRDTKEKTYAVPVITGAELAFVQANNGLKIKTIEYMKREADPSLQPVIEKIEKAMEKCEESDYVESFIEYLQPFTDHLEEMSGIPSEIILAQIALESGWGGSNITVLKNNFLGIGRGKDTEIYFVDIDLGDETKRIKVSKKNDGKSFIFESLNDCLYYYMFVLIQNKDNEPHYRLLRSYIKENEGKRGSEVYEEQVLSYISRGYHPEPDLYVSRCRSIMKKMKK
jgi:flagellum-specific peptidoglycan hydrolase FlgJ